MLNAIIQGKPTLWEQDGWSAQLGGELLVDLPSPRRGRSPCSQRAGVERKPSATYPGCKERGAASLTPCQTEPPTIGPAIAHG